MSESKKSKKTQVLEADSFAAQAWASVIDSLGDIRLEVHKQTGALLGFAEGVTSGAFSMVGKFSDRADALAASGLQALDEVGTEFLARTQALPQRAGQSARDAAGRVSESVRVLTTTKRAA